MIYGCRCYYSTMAANGASKWCFFRIRTGCVLAFFPFSNILYVYIHAMMYACMVYSFHFVLEFLLWCYRPQWISKQKCIHIPHIPVFSFHSALHQKRYMCERSKYSWIKRRKMKRTKINKPEREIGQMGWRQRWTKISERASTRVKRKYNNKIKYFLNFYSTFSTSWRVFCVCVRGGGSGDGNT